MMLPVVAMLSGMLRWPRDIFAGLMYAQGVVYMFIAPSIAAASLPTNTQARYSFFLWWALPLFCGAFLVAYRIVAARLERRWSAPPDLVVNQLASVGFVIGSILMAVGWLWVAFTRNLLYRRLGAEGIAGAQLDLSLIEFGIYRSFMEFAPFFAIYALVVLRIAKPPQRWIQLLWRSCLVVTASLYGLNVLVNSRLAGVLFIAALAGVVLITAPESRRVRPERVVLILMLAISALYVVRVSENIRERISNGGSAFDPSNLDPSGRTGGGEEGYELRLNGIDLMALIADNVEAQGPALGRAWAVPLLLQLDPIFRTDFTEQMKRGALTTSKSFLLLQYAGIAESDYYSCMISDAYGNLGLAGFLAVALVLAGACAVAGVGLRGKGGPTVILIASFVLSRVLPFEQEFASLLFGWLKLLPLIIAIWIFSPLRRRRPAVLRIENGSAQALIGAM